MQRLNGLEMLLSVIFEHFHTTPASIKLDTQRKQYKGNGYKQSKAGLLNLYYLVTFCML